MHKNDSKGYHIDYFFAEKKFIENTKKFEMGKISDWKDKSDHVPILWEF
jgi:exonuclease III